MEKKEEAEKEGRKGGSMRGDGWMRWPWKRVPVCAVSNFTMFHDDELAEDSKEEREKQRMGPVRELDVCM
jgi:hypothetical protein